MGAINSSLINNTTVSQLASDISANKSVNIEELSNNILVTAQNSKDKTPGIFFGKAQYDGNIPILQNIDIIININGWVGANTVAFVYAGAGAGGSGNLIGRSHLLPQVEDDVVNVQFKITNPLISTIKVGVLISNAKKNDSFHIKSFQIYQQSPPINTSYISAQNANIYSWPGGGTGAHRILTSTDLTGALRYTTGSTIILSGHTNTVSLPFINETNLEITAGTNYVLYFAETIENNSIIINTGSSDVICGYINSTEILPTSSSLCISINSTVGDKIELLYNLNKWYITGIMCNNYITIIVNDGNYVPNITSNSINDNYDGTITLSGNVSGPNITSVGFCCSNVDTVNISNTIYEEPYTTGSFTFTVPISQTGNLYGKLYAINSYGISYGSRMEFTMSLCLLEGTIISLADGTTKLIENIEYSDDLLVWDFDNGRFSSAKPLWIKTAGETTCYNRLVFSSGAILNTVLQHRLFNKEQGSFTQPMTDMTPVGTTSFDNIGNDVKLISKEVCYSEAPLKHYNILTFGHLNSFSNSILTSCRYNNIYPIVDMKFVKPIQPDGMLVRESKIPPLFYEGFRISEQPYPIDELEKYIIDRVNLAVPRKILFLDHYGVLTTHLCDNFDPNLVSVLKTILQKYKYDIIVSSDWKRRFTASEIKSLYKQHNLPEPIGFTTDFNHKTIAGYAEWRAKEIKHYLEQHNRLISKWVAIDDLNMTAFLDNFIQTDPMIGLCENTLDKMKLLC